LFFATNGAEITGVRLEAANITGKNNVGALVGSAINTLIDGCEAGGTVKGNTTVGGLVGRLGGNTVINCYSTGTVTATGDNVGGLVGRVEGPSNTNITLERCYSTGTVSGITSVGGLIGRIFYSGLSPIYTVKQCYSTGNVSGNGNNIGGLVGISSRYVNAGTGGETIIEECYASGRVSADGSGHGAGGLVGTLYSSSTDQKIRYCYATGNIIAVKYSMVGGLVGYDSSINIALGRSSMMQCYSTGQVRGNDSVGGFIGFTGAQNITIDKCYYDAVSSGMNSGANKTSLNNQIIGKSPEDMKLSTTYDGWNFFSGGKWGIDEGKDYPYLRSLGETKTTEPLNKERNFSNTSVGSAVPRAIVVGRQLVLSGLGGLSGVGVRFYDLRGRLVWSYAARGSGKVSLGKVPSGRYIMELREGKSRLSVSRVSVR
jgi:hypothetical protein